MLTLNSGMLGVETVIDPRFGVFTLSAEWKICFLIEPLSDLFGRDAAAATLPFFKRIIICCCNGVPWPFSLLNCLINFRFFEDSGSV